MVFALDFVSLTGNVSVLGPEADKVDGLVLTHSQVCFLLQELNVKASTANKVKGNREFVFIFFV